MPEQGATLEILTDARVPAVLIRRGAAQGTGGASVVEPPPQHPVMGDVRSGRRRSDGPVEIATLVIADSARSPLVPSILRETYIVPVHIGRRYGRRREDRVVTPRLS